MRLLSLLPFFAAVNAAILTKEQLTEKIAHLSNGEFPLVRYTVSDATYDRQEESCQDMEDLVQTLKESDSTEVKASAAEMIALCMNERPEHREKISGLEGFHSHVVELMDQGAAAEAAELIYITVFASMENHEAFNDMGAVDRLIEAVMESDDPKELMWSLAALQNMAASYCDGYCSWSWITNEELYDEEGAEEVVGEAAEGGAAGNETEGVIEVHPPMLMTSEEITIDSSLVRQHIVDTEGFLDRLFDLACSSVALEHRKVPFPHESDKHTNHASIIPWAGVGLIKNLALDMGSHDLFEAAMPCLCWMTKSQDDLEYGKAHDALHNLDRDAACHFHDDEESDEPALCIDEYFIIVDGGLRCHDITNIEESCQGADEFGRLASEACCVCGGGNTFDEPTNPSDVELEDAPAEEGEEL